MPADYSDFINVNLLDAVSSSGDGGEDGFVLPVQVGLNAPVEAKGCHGEHHQDPKDLSKDCLVREEDVDQTLRSKRCIDELNSNPRIRD